MFKNPSLRNFPWEGGAAPLSVKEGEGTPLFRPQTPFFVTFFSDFYLLGGVGDTSFYVKKFPITFWENLVRDWGF